MMSREVRIHVNETLEDGGRRFIDAWRRAERGELSSAEHHVSFESWEAFAAVMTPKRLALLRHVHARPARSVRALAQALGRDYRNVHADVEALAGAGLLDRSEAGLRADYGSVHLETRIAL